MIEDSQASSILFYPFLPRTCFQYLSVAFQGWQLAGRGEDPSQEGLETAKEVEQEAVGQSVVNRPLGWVLSCCG